MLGDQYHRSIGDFSFADDLSTIFSHGSSGHSDIDDFHCIDVEDPLSPPFVSFSDYFHGSVVDGGQLVDTPSTHTALLGASGGGGKLCGSGRTSTPVTPKSSVSWSSTEAAAGEEDSVRCKKEVGAEEKQLAKGEEQGGADKSKKANNKPRKKGEKRQREPRFAFVTKSEVDHLEDGYRWRKYGQKAVKNSPYPRSYYRCTTQECLVKKRVERSFKEPSIVITTYEGQHTHQSPAAVRAGSSHVLPPPPQAAMPPSSLGFHQDLLMHQYVLDNNNSQLMMMMQAREIMNPNMYMPSPLQQQQQLKFPDHGLLQDIVLSSNPNQP